MKARGSTEALDRDIWLFHLAFRQLVKLPDELLAERGLSRIHHRVLWVIGRSGEVSVGDIAERLAVTRQALHGPMRQLRTEGLLTSRAAEHNRTLQLVSLTGTGAALEQQLNELQRKHLRLALEKTTSAGAEGWRQVMLALSQVSPEKA